MKVIEAIRARYDGRKRSPFDEAECGHHYARAMASWAAVLALTGFEYSAVDAMLYFAAAKKRATWFWSSGDAWGTFSQAPVENGIEIELRVASGAIKVQTLLLRGWGELYLPRTRVLKAGQSMSGVVENNWS